MRPDGSQQATYHGRPLYLYNDDAYTGGTGTHVGTPGIYGADMNTPYGVFNTIPPVNSDSLHSNKEAPADSTGRDFPRSMGKVTRVAGGAARQSPNGRVRQLTRRTGESDRESVLGSRSVRNSHLSDGRVEGDARDESQQRTAHSGASSRPP